MAEPLVHLAYAPRGAGVLCALFHFAIGPDAYGWFTGAKGYGLLASYFMLEGWYSAREAVFLRSAENDAYGCWLVADTHAERPIDPPSPVPDDVLHELVAMQGAFAAEWLAYAADPAFESVAVQLRDRGLVPALVNVRPDRLGKLAPGAAIWTHSSSGIDLGLVRFLARRWTLDYSPE